MTSGFRLILAILAAGIALIAGLAQGYEDTTTQADREARTLPEIDAWTAAEVDTLAQRIVAAGLYPDAELAGTDTVDTGGVDIGDVEAAFVDPALRAFIKVDGQWSLSIQREGGDSQSLRQGDFLTDDWQVMSISATSVTFERGGGTRTLDAYPSREG